MRPCIGLTARGPFVALRDISLPRSTRSHSAKSRHRKPHQARGVTGEQPTQFDFVINAKTTKVGLAVLPGARKFEGSSLTQN